MSQAAFLRDLDATITDAFAGVGMSDTSCWRGKRGGAADDITALVDHGVQLIGTDGGVVDNQTTIRLFRAELPQDPGEDDSVTVGTDRYKLVRKIDSDESSVQFAVRLLG